MQYELIVLGLILIFSVLVFFIFKKKKTLPKEAQKPTEQIQEKKSETQSEKK